MSTSRTIAGIILGLFLALSANGQVRYMVFVPSVLDRETATAAWKSTVHLVKYGKVGDIFEFYDGVTQTRLAACIKPAGSNTIAVKAMAPHLMGIKAHLASASPDTSRSSGWAGNNVHIPAIARTVQAAVAADQSTDEQRTTRVIIFGSLFHNDPHDPAATFGHGEIPNDAAITAGNEVAFGTSDRLGTLEGVYIDLGYTDLDLASRDLDATTRFWSLFFERQSAVLTSCRPASLESAENAVKGLAIPLAHTPLDARDQRPMIVKIDGSFLIDEEGKSRVLGPPVPLERIPDPAPVHESRIDQVLKIQAQAIPLPTSGQLIIAAVWTTSGGDADVDLYVRPNPSAEELYYKHKNTAEGRYLRDIVSSNSSNSDRGWRSAWECVEINEATLSTTSVWLNLFNCTADRVDGFVRVVFTDRTFDIPFSFAKTPSGGEGSNTRANHRAWQRIDIPVNLLTEANAESAGSTP